VTDRPGAILATEPLALAELARLVLVVLVALAWTTIPSFAVTVVLSGAATILSVLLTWWCRESVTPVAAPKPPR
jgi:apolipoprotein N-acyltransferase